MALKSKRAKNESVKAQLKVDFCEGMLFFSERMSCTHGKEEREMSEKRQKEKLRGNSKHDHREMVTNTHSASWWRRVTSLAGLVLISWSLLVSPVVAKDIAPHPNANCTDPDNYMSGSKAHPDDPDHGPCSIWRSLERSCLKDPPEKWSSSHHYPHHCYNKLNWEEPPPVVIVQVKGCHFLAVPTVPVIGVEDADNRDKYPYWYYAWLAATIPATPITIGHTKKSVGLAVNPVEHRTQHQLHIHIGRTKYSLRNYLRDHFSHDGKWHHIPAKKVYGKTCYAKFVKYDPKKDPFPSPFKEVSERFGEDKMEHAGIILAGDVDKNGSFRGLYIVSCYDTWVEDKFLTFRCDAN